MEAPSKSYISSSFGKPPQSSPWLYKYRVKQRSLTLSCCGVNLFQHSADSDLISFKARVSATALELYLRSHIPGGRYCTFSPAQLLLVVTTPADVEINESLAAGLSSEITDLAEQQKPFFHCLNIWIVFMLHFPNSLETLACRFKIR